MKLQLPGSVTRAFYGAGLKLKKRSPELLVVGGIIGGVTAAVMACKATTQLDDILEEHKKKAEIVRDGIKHPETLVKPYTEEEGKKAITLVYAQTGFELFKLYAPSVALGTLSIAAILSGHNILRKRNVALAAAYTAIDNSFKEYRGRVVERFGEALDKELRYNIKTKEVEEVVTNEDGSETIVKKTAQVADIGKSEYCRFFDETSSNWTRNAEYNKKFLIDMERFANDMLKERGHVFLNEVHDLLGIDRTTAGAVVGWLYRPNDPNHKGDNYISFNICDLYSPANRRFVNGFEKSVLLDFNVDGPIHEMI